MLYLQQPIGFGNANNLADSVTDGEIVTWWFPYNLITAILLR